ncbi:SRPBCC family protein [Glaciibacter sp. 2TAF33]|uniref:SRPBCC family protein n=1 Tax=Glaciibacter sp. 2TAF33 TaxID=3233015 RepID=UPI003F8F4C4D
MNDFIARAQTTIAAPASRVWKALTDPGLIRQYMFGTEVITTWEPGTSIRYRGEWEGKPYEDKGTILDFEPEKRMRSTHFSPLGGQPDAPENYHTLTYTLAEEGGRTTVTLTQDNNPDQAAAAHSESMWQPMLESLRELVESGTPPAA